MSKGLNIVGANRSDGTDRQNEDFYATDPQSITDLTKFVDIKGLVWENAVGSGNLSRELKKLPNVTEVIGTDIIDRGTGDCDYIVDFLELPFKPFECKNFNWIITNPPYKYGKRWIQKSLEYAPNVAMLMKLVFLESADRKEFFKTSGLKQVLVYSKRLGVYKNNIKTKNSGLVAYSWFIFERGYKGKPIIDWI